MDRLAWLREAQRLERKWDNIAGADNCPARKKLEPLIREARRNYDALTAEFIKGGEK
jgi:hypothetical protein